jgi:hypothetical protein
MRPVLLLGCQIVFFFFPSAALLWSQHRISSSLPYLFFPQKHFPHSTSVLLHGCGQFRNVVVHGNEYWIVDVLVYLFTIRTIHIKIKNSI